jgi:hypothetical protein
MARPHDIDPRASHDPRNVYLSDEQFYASDRPEHPELAEDRPRGGSVGESVKHRTTWGTVALIAFIVLLVITGIALFP